MKARIARCPYCNYVWQLRMEHPKACPRDKKRFDAPWSKPPEIWEKEYSNSDELRAYLNKLNKEAQP